MMLFENLLLLHSVAPSSQVEDGLSYTEKPNSTGTVPFSFLFSALNYLDIYYYELREEGFICVDILLE